MGQMMAEDRQGMFLFAKDVQEILGVSRNYAYVIIRELNEELAKQGYRVVAGRVLIQNNSHKCFSSESDETMQAFFDIMQDRDRTPEERADILLRGVL